MHEAGFREIYWPRQELLSLGGPLSGEERKKHTRRLELHLFLAEPAPWCLLKDGAGARGFGKEVAGGARSLRAPHRRKAGSVGWRLPWATSKQLPLLYGTLQGSCHNIGFGLCMHRECTSGGQNRSKFARNLSHGNRSTPRSHDPRTCTGPYPHLPEPFHMMQPCFRFASQPRRSWS